LHITTFVGKTRAETPEIMDSRKASLFICRAGWLPVNSPPDKGSKIALPNASASECKNKHRFPHLIINSPC
jgi:hypothetical protein